MLVLCSLGGISRDTGWASLNDLEESGTSDFVDANFGEMEWVGDYGLEITVMVKRCDCGFKFWMIGLRVRLRV